MRKKISEKNIYPQFDLFNEYEKIEFLLSENKVIGQLDRWGGRKMPVLTMEDYINQVVFSDWNLRGTFLSINEMREGLEIDKNELLSPDINEEKILDFLQYAINCTIRVEATIKKFDALYIADKNYTKLLSDNIRALLTRLKATFELDKKTNEIFVAYQDDLSVVVAENNPQISDSLSEYNRIDNRGDLKRKGEILCTLFKSLEPIEKKFKGTEYASLASDTTFLFNKIGARHWVENDKIASVTFLKMTPDELEKWYDKTYTMFISCMVTSAYLDIKPEIKQIKQAVEAE